MDSEKMRGFKLAHKYKFSTKGRQVAESDAKKLRSKGYKAEVKEGTVRGRKVWKLWFREGYSKKTHVYDPKSREWYPKNRKPYWMK